MYLVTAEEMRAFDTAAIREYGIPGVVLMENAGRTTFEILRAALDDDVRGLKVSVVAGPGNNGGDGFVIARYLLNHGADVQTFLLAPREKIKGDALVNLQVLEHMTSRIFDVDDEAALQNASWVWHGSDVIVDAILGTGLTSDVRPPYSGAVERINDAPGFTLAVDIPTGIDSDTGRVLGVAVMADLTATYGFRKLGTAISPGAEYCGHVEVVDISIPQPAVESSPPKASLYDEPDTETFFRLRSDPDAHKGTFGHVLVVGGSPGKTGAPAMAAMAASRIGAGLVTVGIPASLNPILEAKLTEEMTEPLPESVPGYLSTESADRILDLAEGKQCLVLGPGLSTEGSIPGLAKILLEKYKGWLLIDADGLNAITGDLDAIRNSTSDLVLTPHPGEMGRLLGKTSQEVQEDRLAAARETAMDLGAWIVLKGAGTVTASPDGRVFINSTGNTWMASGGQGDALSGMLGGLLAQRIPPDEALPLGVYLHGLAADRRVERIGPAPVLATDVIEEIPVMLGELDE